MAASKPFAPRAIDVFELHTIASRRRDELIIQARELLELGNCRGAQKLLARAARLEERLRALQSGFSLPWAPGGTLPN